jgi:hypothetical protein
MSCYWRDNALAQSKNQRPDAFLYANGPSILVTVQLASPSAYALLGDRADAHGCISLTEDAFVNASEKLDAAGLWLRPL